MNIKQEIKEILADLDQPLQMEEKTGLLKKGKYRVIIIYEDMSFKRFFVKLKKSFSFTIKGREYIVLPRCIIRGKNPILLYYFNNPMPIYLKYEKSPIQSKHIYDKKEFDKLPEDLKIPMGNVEIDGESLNHLLTTNMLKNLYPKGGFSPKWIVIILVVAFIILMLILHFTGVIDITGFFIQK